jgi:pseudomonalisin/xanthomonalisin
LSALALAAATFCGAAQSTEKSAEGWASTHTQAVDLANATAGLAVQPGQTLHIAVTLRMRNQADMDALTTALMTGQTARHITSAEFLSHYAPTAAQAQAVVDHLQRAGFIHIKVAPNRMLVSADGTAATVKAAFKTDLRRVTVEGREAFANVSTAQVPAHLAGIVNAVHGLQSVYQAHPMHVVADAKTAASGVTGHNPLEFPKIYDADTLAPATKGAIGIIAAGDISSSITDLSAFVAANGLQTPVVNQVVVGVAGTDTSGALEWNLDSQTSLSAAGSQIKSMTFYIATSLDDAPLTEAYNQAVSDNTTQAVNVSLGECETAAQSSGIMASNDAIFQIAMAQGQVFSVSSGDSGSYECGKKTGGQSYPATSPYVMALGGTTLSTDTTGAWAGETVWGCNSLLACELSGGAGGGASVDEPAPAWQIKAGVLGGSTFRGVPDISFDASPNSGALILQGGKTVQVGGTSLAAPLFTGFWVRMQSIHGGTLTFPAAQFYKFGKSKTAVYHDVTSGSNGGYKAGTGWDYASGFGSFDVSKMSKALGK